MKKVNPIPEMVGKEPNGPEAEKHGIQELIKPVTDVLDSPIVEKLIPPTIAGPVHVVVDVLSSPTVDKILSTVEDVIKPPAVEEQIPPIDEKPKSPDPDTGPIGPPPNGGPKPAEPLPGPIVAPPAATKDDPAAKARGPWEVEPGPDSLFQVSTRLMGEREIDVQDRGAKVRLTVKVLPQEKKNIGFKNVAVILHLPGADSSGQGRFYGDKPKEKYQQVAVGVMGGGGELPATYVSKGDLIVYEMTEDEILLEGGQLEKILYVRTGVFSDSQLENSAAALAGLKEYWLEIRYRAVEIGGQETTSVEMYFEVAKD